MPSAPRPIPAPAARAVPTLPPEPAAATADSTWGDSVLPPLKPLREILLGRSYETWMLDVVWSLNFLQFQHVRYVRYVNMIKTVYGLSMKLVGLMSIDGGFEAFGA